MTSRSVASASPTTPPTDPSPETPSAPPPAIEQDESVVRYLAYGARLRSLFTAGSRYLAFTSDVGEAFRPVVRPMLVRAAYGVSWAYVAGDVAYEGWKESLRGGTGSEIGQVVAKRAVFQTVASMALPAFTIHTTVHVAHKVLHRVGRFQKWGPTVAGLSLLPALPFMFDLPVEHALEYAWPNKHEHQDPHGAHHGAAASHKSKPE